MVDEEAQTKPLVSEGMEAPPPNWDAETAARLCYWACTIAYQSFVGDDTVDPDDLDGWNNEVGVGAMEKRVYVVQAFYWQHCTEPRGALMLLFAEPHTWICMANDNQGSHQNLKTEFHDFSMTIFIFQVFKVFQVVWEPCRFVATNVSVSPELDPLER